MAGILLACAVLTWRQAATWRNDVVLWRHALAATGSNAMTHFSLGTALYRQGNVDEAEDHLRAALAEAPNFSPVLTALAVSLRRQGQLDEAARMLTQALQPDAWSPALIWSALGLTRYQQGRLPEACACFREATRLEPANAEYWYNLGTALEESGASAEAARAYQEGRRIDPSWPEKADAFARFFLTARHRKIHCPAERSSGPGRRARRRKCSSPGCSKPWPPPTRPLATRKRPSPRPAWDSLAAAQDRKDIEAFLRQRLRDYEALAARKKAAPGPRKATGTP